MSALTPLQALWQALTRSMERRIWCALLAVGIGPTWGLAMASSERGPEIGLMEKGLAPGTGTEFPRLSGWKVLRRDTVYLLRRPTRLDRGDRRRIFATVGTTAGLYLLRDEIREVVQRNRGPGREDFLQSVRTMGKGGTAPSLALGFALSSLATRNPRERETAQLLMESMAFSAAAAGLGSFVLATERPEDGDSIGFLDIEGHGVSLDAALAASVVVPLRRQYLHVCPDDGRWRKFVKRLGTTLLYTGAILTSYQRLDQDKHWAGDAFLGTVAGFTVGAVLSEAHGLPAECRAGPLPGRWEQKDAAWVASRSD